MIFLLKRKIKRFLTTSLTLIGLTFTCCAVAQHALLEQKAEDWRVFLQTGAFERVIDSCSYALETYNFEQDKAAHSDFISLQATAFRYLGQLDLAIDGHHKALTIRENFLGKEDARTASSLLNLGNCYWEISSLELAFQHYERALDIKEKLFGPNALTLISVQNSLANYYLKQNDFTKAAQLIERNLHIAGLHEQTESTLIVPSYITLANIQLQQQKQSTLALNNLKKALLIQQDASAFYHPNTAAIYKSLGNCLYEKGEYWVAIDTLTKATELYQAIGGNENDLSDCHLNLGNCYADLGDISQALIHYKQASFYLKDQAENMAEVSNNMGLAYKYNNQLSEAIRKFDEVSNLFQSLPDPSIQQQRLNADVQLNLGSCYLSQNQVEGALYYYEEGHKLHKQLNSPPIKIAQINNKLGFAKFSYGDTIGALKLITQNLDIELTELSPMLNFSTNYYLGQIYTAQKKYYKSLDHYQSALSAIQPKEEQSLIFPFERIQVYTAMADLYLQIGKIEKDSLQKALAYSDLGIELLNKLKGNFSSLKSEVDLQNVFYDLYNTAIESSLLLSTDSLAYQQTAFQFANQYKGNILKKLSRKASAKTTFQLPDSLFQRERKIQANLNRYQQLQFFEDQQQQFLGIPNQPTVNDSMIAILTNERNSLLKHLKEHYPKYFQLVHEDRLIKPSAIQKALTVNQTLIEYQWGRADIWAFVFRRDTFFIKTIPNANQIGNDIERLNSLYTQRPDLLPKQKREAIVNELVELASKLHQNLVEPFESILTPDMIIVPDGMLCYLPFELLIQQKPKKNRLFRSHQYLIKDHAIAYDYSSSIFLNRFEAKNKTQGKHSLLAVAPIFDQYHPILNPLKHNRREAKLIQELIGGTLWNKGEDSKARLLEHIDQFSLVHLSTHGVLLDASSELSYLAFSNPTDSLIKEQLTVAEIYNLELSNNEMIVLSACKTAEGTLSRGEGLLSLAHAFIYAGAKSLVASLWNVDDRHTPKLMEYYYQHLKSGHSKSIALQHAKKDYLINTTHEEAFPFYWAGFIMIGDNSPLFDSFDGQQLNYLFFLGIGVVLVFFLLKKWPFKK